MPYTIRKVAGGWAVYKKKPDGSLGARKNKKPHTSKAKAGRHLRALYAAEGRKK